MGLLQIISMYFVHIIKLSVDIVSILVFRVNSPANTDRVIIFYITS